MRWPNNRHPHAGVTTARSSTASCSGGTVALSHHAVPCLHFNAQMRLIVEQSGGSRASRCCSDEDSLHFTRLRRRLSAQCNSASAAIRRGSTSSLSCSLRQSKREIRANQPRENNSSYIAKRCLSVFSMN
jgi:hypothetical protein